MSDIITFISTYLGATILITISGIFLKWLFIRSAVKSGVIAALENVLTRINIDETSQNNNDN